MATPRRGHNAYNTTDPAEWLHLKREESELMLSIVRGLRPDQKAEEQVRFVVQRVREQLDVGYWLLVRLQDDTPHVLAREGAAPELQPDQMACLRSYHNITAIEPDVDRVLYDLGVEYVIPLGPTDAPNAWICIADFADSDIEVENDLTFIETVGNILETSLMNLTLFEQQAEQERIKSELEMASQIQRKSLPSNFDLDPRLEVTAMNLAHFKVSGDFYDLVRISDDELFISIADVTGKGLAAALVVANVQTNLRVLLKAERDLDSIAQQVHEAVADLTHFDQFVTLFMAKFNLKERTFRYVNCGHNPPLLLSGGKIEELKSTCIPLGILPVEHVGIQTLQYAPGDVLLLYTDGAVEQVNPKDDMLGLEPVKKLLWQYKDASPDEIATHTHELITAFAEGQHHVDDLSLMVVKAHEG